VTFENNSHINGRQFSYQKNNKLEMWANAQRDGCRAKYMWCPLFNATK